MSKQKSTNKKRDQAVTLAILGGFVTITTVLISSLVAPIALELIRRTPVPANTSSSLGALAATNTVQSSSTIQTLAPAATFTSPAIENVATQEWSHIMSVNLDPASPLLCQGLLLPPNIRPDQDINLAAKQVMDEWKGTDDPFSSWLFVSNPSTNGVSLLLTLTNLPDRVDWIKLENKLDVSINAESNPPDQVNVLTVTGCGAGGLYRTFSDVSLASEFQNYKITSASSDFDFFSLQPGESEIFELSLNCQAPGIYRATFNIPYSSLESRGMVEVEYDRSIICPSAFTVWTMEMADEAFVSSKSYVWNGTGYAIRP